MQKAYGKIIWIVKRGGVRVPAKSQFLSFQGLRVHFRVAEPEGELQHRVLALSSPLSSTFNWRKLLPELTQLGCLVVMLDLPGFGESDCGPGVPQSNELRANIAWGVLDEFDRKLGTDLSLWHLMAHGSACQTILTMANEYPDSVRSQIHLSPTLERALVPRPRRAAVGGTKLEEKWFARNVQNPEGFRRFVGDLFARQPDDYVLEHMRRCLTRPGSRESFLHMLRNTALPEPAKGFSPVMVLSGGQDVLQTEQVQETFGRLLPEAERHVLRTAGYFPMETHSKAVRDYLRGWLRYVG